MAVKRYYIFRHGETFATKNNTSYGMRVLTAPILDEGRPTIKKIGEYLADKPSDYNVSSALLRCKQTAGVVSDVTGKTFHQDKRLNEYFLETVWHFRKRVKSFMKDIDDAGYETVMICTHGAVISALINLLTTGQFGIRDLFRYPDPGVLVIIEDKKLETINFNEPPAVQQIF